LKEEHWEYIILRIQALRKGIFIMLIVGSLFLPLPQDGHYDPHGGAKPFMLSRP